MKRTIEPPTYPRVARSDWWPIEYYRYYTTPEGKLARQDTRIPLRYAKPPKPEKVRQPKVSTKGLPNTGHIRAARLKELRDEQETLMNSLKLRAGVVEEGSVTPVRRKELAAGFAAAGMAHLIG